ncbi:MAG: Hsp70 family protein, partial [Paracoccaceae bacterium]
SPARARQPDRQSDILANDGIRVGGTDFDRLLSLASVMPQLGLGSFTKDGKITMPLHYYHDLATWHRINALYTQRCLTDLKQLRYDAAQPALLDRLIHVITTRAGHALLMATEAAKITLSDYDQARIHISPFTGGKDATATREGFEAAVATPISRIHTTLHGLLAQAGLRPSQIGTVFMTGGSSSLPILHACVADVLPGVAIATGDLLGSVGTGLALDARAKFG